MEEVITTEVSTETPVENAAPTGKAAFAAARAEIRQRAQSRDQAPAEDAPTETTPEEKKPAQEPEKPADALPEAGETEDALLTPDEVSKLSPKELNLYKKAQANYTQKTQKVAARAKELEGLANWKSLIEDLQSDPDGAIERMAAKRGLKLSKPEAQNTHVAESKTAETLAELPEGWEFLKPILDAHGKRVESAIMATLDGKMKPIEEAHHAALSNAVAAETKSTLEAFTAAHPGWNKHEAAMLEMGKKFMPAQGAMTDFEYMETLYKLATFGETQADKTKAVIEKINKISENAEPATTGVDSTRVVHVMPAGLEDSGKRFKAAFAAAKRGERWVE